MLFRLKIRFVFSILHFILLFQTYFKANYTKFFPYTNYSNTILLISLSFIIISISLYNNNISFAQNFDVDDGDVDGRDNSAEFFSGSIDDTTISDNRQSNVPFLSDSLEEPTALTYYTTVLLFIFEVI